MVYIYHVGPPESWMSTRVVLGPPALVLFEFGVDDKPSRHICFTKRPEELYDALTTALDRKWKGEKIDFTGGGYKGSIEKGYLRSLLLVIEISPPYALICDFLLKPQEANAIRNKMAILLA